MNKFRASLISLTALTAFGISLPTIMSVPAHAETVSSDATIEAPVNTLYQALLKTQGKTGESMTAQQRFDTIKPAVVASYDLNEILRKTIGARFNKLNNDQKTALEAAFERFTVAHYIADFKPSANAIFAVDPTITDGGAGARLVKTTVRGPDPDDKPTVLSYLMSNKTGSWRITDVLVGGSISQVAIQRFDFLTQFKVNGPAALTKTLDQKANEYLAEH